MNSIQFDPHERCFFLRLRHSFYSFRILTDGQVVHVGSGPWSAGDATPWARLDDYEESNYSWETQGRRHELPAFGDITYHDVALKVAFPHPHRAVRDVRLRYHDHEIQSDILRVRLKDEAYDFWVTLGYRVAPEYDIIERWLELDNRTSQPIEVEALAFGTVHLPNGRYELTRVAGIWAREFIPMRHNLDQGEFVLDQRGLNTGHAANPFYLLNERGQATEDAGVVYFGALAFSGNWSLRFEALPTTALRVHGGYEPSDFELTLAPGETHRTPSFVHGCCAEGWGGASRRLHRFIRERVLPKKELRPVLYNSWEATYFHLTLENQTALARLAASIGVELFCVDDGWFGARRHDRAGLGDWVVSPQVFPGGLNPLIAEVKRLGMKFGLWVEPEMVNPDSDLYRAHPDWVLHFPGRPRTEQRNQLVLDFGRPEVVEFIFNALDRLLRENEIDFFKWDMNRYATEPGSVAGKAIWRRHVEAVYGIMDRLRRAHPGLDIQSCSGGGGRVDLGILARTEQAWTSDNTDAHDRTLIQDGFSLAYPPRVMECWVTHETNHQTGRPSSLDLRFDVAMRGVLGIGASLDQLTTEELAMYRRKIAFYKIIRPIVQQGDLYRLHVEPGLSIWQTVLPDGSRSVYSIIVTQHLQGIHRAPSRLRALRTDAIYKVTDDTGKELGSYSGGQLMTLGLPGDTVHGGGARAIHSRTLLLAS